MDTGIEKKQEDAPLVGSYSYKDVRMYAIALGQQLQRLRKGEIDKVVIAEIDCSGSSRSQFGGNSLNLYVITKEDYIKKWPAKWGFKSNMTDEDD